VLPADEPAGAPRSSLARSSTIMAIGTVASRGTGFVRTVVLAAALGSGALAETYNIPNTIPNAIYDLLLGGILTSVVVPLLVTAVRDDAQAGELYAQRLLTVVAVVLGVCTVVGVLAAPLIIDVYAQGLTGQQRSLSVTAAWLLPRDAFQVSLQQQTQTPIGSNGQTVLAAADLRSYFAVTMSTEQVAHGKPAPDIYLAVAATLGRAPADCAAVEDSSNGLRSAAAAGLHVIAVPHPQYPPDPDALAAAAQVLPALADLTPAVVAALA